jgi:hypothetical protein
MPICIIEHLHKLTASGTVYYSMTKSVPFNHQMSIGDSIPKVPDRFPEDLRKTLHSCLEIEVAHRPQTIELYKTTTKHVAEQDQAQSHLSPSATSTLHKVPARMNLENVAVNDAHGTLVSLPLSRCATIDTDCPLLRSLWMVLLQSQELFHHHDDP